MSIPTVAINGVPDPLPEGLAVLDVREQVEWAHGHIEGSVHVPLMELPQRLAEAVGYLRQQGYDAVNLDGGLLEWEAAGRALVSETGRPPVVV
jgi:rhodanese-related sulfurtransferase